MEWEPEVPRWRQVYGLLEKRIYDGKYAPGERLPSALAIVEETGISPVTARRVLKELRDAGLAYMEPGIGTFVSRLPDPPADSPSR
ncbi:winged helix-turn-helix domain-containing protein [Streptomyces sp. NPDC047980]|uniref:winged helix-turn-helix domain-containing protein n=1 Tax=Streptomyces sp. NPDC047980 TaxID=3365494 RepID=UPI0037179110